MIDLQFGSFKLVRQSDQYGFYILASQQMGIQEYQDIAMPGTAGRYRRFMGYAQSDYTSPQWEFECRISGTISEIENHVQQAQAIMASSLHAVDILRFGYADSSRTMTIRNCQMDYRPGEIWKSSNGVYVFGFQVRFVKIGV